MRDKHMILTKSHQLLMQIENKALHVVILPEIRIQQPNLNKYFLLTIMLTAY